MLSPHFDDVPLSLGQSLRDGALAACSVRVRVLFGRTNWTTWVHPSPSRARWVSAWRSLEELVASWRFGYRFSVAGWSEVVLRTGVLDPERLLDADLDLSDEPLVADVARWLERVLTDPVRGEPPQLCLAPAGLGGHVDHRITARAAATLLASSPVPIAFYEDRPYAAYLSEQERAAQLGALDADLVPIDVSGPILRSTQLRARQCYPSQMDPFFEDAMSRDLGADSVERIWMLPESVPAWLR